MSESRLHDIDPVIRARAKELRHPLTPEEQILWNRVRNRRLGGYKFRRQVPLGSFIVDFYCPETRLVIEIDGEIHRFQQDYDKDRTAWLVDEGLSVIRFTNDEIRMKLNEVLDEILEYCQNYRATSQY